LTRQQKKEAPPPFLLPVDAPLVRRIMSSLRRIQSRFPCEERRGLKDKRCDPVIVRVDTTDHWHAWRIQGKTSTTSVYKTHLIILLIVDSQHFVDCLHIAVVTCNS
jgi:hypothetical protein